MVLVSIVGDFDSSVLPIFYEFKDDITKHILLYDDFKNDVIKAQNLKKGIDEFKKKNNYSFKTLAYKIDEDSLSAIEESASYLLSQVQDPSDLFINSTDGLSTITAVLHHKLIKKGVQFVSYDMYDNEYNILNKKTLNKHPIQNQMNIKEHFLLKGFNIQKSDAKKFANKYEPLLQNLFQNHSEKYDEFLKMPTQSITIKQLPKKHKTIKNLLVKMNLGDLHIKNSNATGLLFESYIYNLLKRLKHDDIEIGMKIVRSHGGLDIENEFDILIIKNNHLHMIECKYRNHIDLEQLIYKYIALSDIIDEDGRMIIVAKKAQNNHLSQTQSRGKLSNIEVTGDVAKNPTKFVKMVKDYLLDD